MSKVNMVSWVASWASPIKLIQTPDLSKLSKLPKSSMFFPNTPKHGCISQFALGLRSQFRDAAFPTYLPCSQTSERSRLEPWVAGTGPQQLTGQVSSIGCGAAEFYFLLYIKIRSWGPLPKANTLNLSHCLPMIHRMEFTMGLYPFLKE